MLGRSWLADGAVNLRAVRHNEGVGGEDEDDD
jgi:hypothetical protein